MSIVKKLIIQGVRSFSPHDNKQQMIDFQTPLTLILGVNGSGKTTIIEALKYAITNKFPPNCLNGSSFVNDPKLTNGFDAMAVVKLEVIDAHGNIVLTTRRVKVTVKDKLGNLTKKELDATLRIIDVKGDLKEVNSKCVDTKAEMCRIMGVSEAILNHVIFCHQEDSCWPLDEAKKVKEKFDSIFNTTMYIKCLDQLTKQDKDLATRIKLEHEKLKYVIENRQTARRKKKDSELKDIELKAVTDQIEKFEKELLDMESRLRDLQDLEKKYTEMSNQVSTLQATLQSNETQVTELKSNIKEEFKGNISALKDFIKSFKEQHRDKAGQQKLLQQQLGEKDEELRKLNVSMKNLLLEEGKHQQEESANKKRLAIVVSQISEISSMVKKLKETSQDTSFSHHINSCIELCDGDPNTVSPETVVKTLSAAVRAKESEMNKTKIQYEQEEKEIQKNIDELRTKAASLQTQITMKKKEMEDNTILAIELKNRLRTIEGSNATLAILEDEMQKFIREIEVIQKSAVLEKYEAEIKNISIDIKELEKNISNASDDVDLLTKDKNKLDQIAIFSRQKAQKQNECNEIMRRIEDDLKTLLGTIPETNIGKAVDKKREAIIKELNQKRNKQKQHEKEITVSETELKRVKNDLEKKERKIEGWKVQIDELLEDRSFDDVYEELSKNLESSQKDNYYSEAARYLYKKYIQKLNRKDCCPLCKRDIETKQKLKQLINEIEADVEKMQQNDPLEKAKIDKLKKKQQELLDIKPMWDEKIKLETEEIPALKTKKTSMENKLSELTETMDDLNGTLAILDNEFSVSGKCSKDVGLYESASKEVKQREANIASIESTRDPRAKNFQETKTLSDVITQLQDLKGTLSAKQVEKENKSDLLNRKRNELTKHQEDKNKLREEILRITSELQNREALEVQKKELEQSNKQLQESTAELSLSLPNAKADIGQAEKDKSTCIEKKDKRLHELRLEKESLEKKKSNLSDLTKQIEEYDQMKGQFADLQRRTADCKRKMGESERQKNELSKELESIKNEISNHELKLRDLSDNLSCKEKMEEISKLKITLAEKQKLFAGTHNRGVTAEKRELSQKHQDLSAKMNQHRGQKKEIMVAIAELRKELSETHLVKAEEEYIEKLVKKTIYEKAQKDVKRYKTALDHAIMQFHSKRMETINKILGDYWRQIYKGNDIDTIKIRTESAGSTKLPAGSGHKVKVDTGKSRKTYNYRVVMDRCGHELDMRGRCSAGQRVLASIIIRIALAETFSSRCGIITLDEPTTNLDQRNINSLADALSTLAEKMSARNNFQLIVITHDQDFTDRLSEIDSVEKYWKVNRDVNGFSQITAVPKRG